MRCRHYRGEKTESACHSCSPSVIPAKAGIQGRCAVVGAASHAARRGRQENSARRGGQRKAALDAATTEEGGESYKDNNLLAVVGAASHAARRGRQENSAGMARLRKRRREADGRRHEMPPLQRRGRGRNPACSFCHSERSACPESFEGKNLSLKNRALGKADSFLRQTLRKTQGVLRTGATLGMTMLVYCRR